MRPRKRPPHNVFGVAGVPLAFRAICPYCGFELPSSWSDNDDMWWFERDPSDPDPIASFEDDMRKKVGESAAWRVVTGDASLEEFFWGLRCPACGHYMVPAFRWKG